MTRRLWNEGVRPPGNQAHLWELFHENSKLSPFDGFIPDAEVRARTTQMYEALPYQACPRIALAPDLATVKVSFEQALFSRISSRELEPAPIPFRQLSTLLYLTDGVTRRITGQRAQRSAPSGGGLFPLEIYFHVRHADPAPGLYHFNPTANDICQIRPGDITEEITEHVLQKEIAQSASLLFFITALFERTTFKYADRGYRFCLLEAGHIAQNLNIAATALGLGVVNLGGFMDTEIDRLLGLDSVTHATLYMVALGKRRAPGKSAKPAQSSDV